MALKEMQCPNCRENTMVDESRKICYCIYCGYRIDVVDTGAGGLEFGFNPGKQSVKAAAEGSVPVEIVVPGSTAAIRVFVDGREVLSSFGGTERTMVHPGHHKVMMKLGLASATVEGELSEGSRVVFELAGFAKYRGHLERSSLILRDTARQRTESTAPTAQAACIPPIIEAPSITPMSEARPSGDASLNIRANSATPSAVAM